MSQKLQDFVERLQKERKMQVIVASCVLLVVLFFLLDKKPKQAQPQNVYVTQTTSDVSSGKMSNEEAYEDIVQRFSADLSELKQKSDQTAQDNVEIKKNLFDYEQRTADIFKKILERIQETEANGSGRRNVGINAATGQPIDPSMPLDADALGSEDMAGSIQTDEIESFGMEQADNAPPPAPPQAKVAYVGAGDSVRVKLLAGVNAPTDGTPYPVLLKLVSDVYGPDGSALPIGEARLIAAAQGSLTDSRALFRLTSLNVRFPDGRRKVLDVDGWIVGEDGLRGMSGILIDPIGKVIAGSGLAGAVAGIGEGFSTAQLTNNSSSNGGNQSFLTGDVGIYAAGKGFSGAASTWSDIIRERLGQMVPQVQVLSGREGTAIFAKGFAIPGLYEAMEEGQADFSSLD